MPKLTFYTRTWRMRMMKEQPAGFFVQLLDLIEAQGWETNVEALDNLNKFTLGVIEEYALVEKMLVPHENVLSIRETAFKGFWTLENAQFRDNFRLAKEEFNPELLPKRRARQFSRALLNREGLRSRSLPNAQPINEDGLILVALQGRLFDHRHEQFCSPIEMMRLVRAHEPNKRVMIRLHPSDDYGVEELKCLENLCEEFNFERSHASLADELTQTRYVVTMNSSVAQTAMLWGIPSLLFAHADFHHICVSLHHESNVEDAFEKIQTHRPDFERYLLWYLSHNMLDFRSKLSRPQAINMMADLGFPLSKMVI